MAAAGPAAARPERPLLAPELPLASAVRLTMAAASAAITAQADAAVAGEVEPIHQMRVGARRSRAIVQLFASAIHGSRARACKRDLPWLGHAAGAVRECDVIEAALRECADRLDPAIAGALAPLSGALAAERRAALARFTAEVHSRRYLRMCERLADPLLRRALPATPAGCAVPEMIAPIARAARKAGRRIAPGAPPELFHRLRVRLKRLRYALETLAAMSGKRTRKALARFEEMQDLLGRHQDAVDATAWLRGWAAHASDAPPATLMAVGAIHHELSMRREKLAASACRRWRKIVRSGILDDALKELARAAEPYRNAVSEDRSPKPDAEAAASSAASSAPEDRQSDGDLGTPVAQAEPVAGEGRRKLQQPGDDSA